MKLIMENWRKHLTQIEEGFFSKRFKPSEKNNILKYIESGNSILDYLEKNRGEVANVKYYLGVFLKTLGAKSHSSKFEDYIVNGFFQDGVVKSDALKKIIYDFRDSDYNAEDLSILNQKIVGLLNEAVSLDIEVGDIVLGGKYKNKRMEVKEIGEDELGQPTINGKPILKFRIEKKLPDSKKSKKTLDLEKEKE